ncbi:Cytochrome c [Nesidiocoris tenuis]|uniref:Cytochrome c n=1 Tax=Nesidiocoris tenuis TaxID=355587 RepID=A0ABN7B0S5_9HEMI|nr:Cytochrome c [Nesidiocoris tenuis]
MDRTDFIGDDEILKSLSRSSLLNEANLRRLNLTLDFEDAVSLLYLVSDGGRDVAETIYCQLCEAEIEAKSSFTRVNFANICLKNVRNWQSRLVDALVEIEYFKGLMDVFGVNRIDALYNIRANDSGLIANKLRIFRLCDSLDSSGRREFLKHALTVFDKPTVEHVQLEMYFLFWQMRGELDPSGSGFHLLVRCLQEAELHAMLDIIAPDSHVGAKKLSIDDYNLDKYPILDKSEIGLCLIVNQFEFDDSENNRASSCQDETSLRKVMLSLRFKVEALHNLLSLEMALQIKRAINSNFNSKKHSILWVIVMSHGQDGHVMGRDGVYVPTKDLALALHESKGLRRVPKILVICACRGSDVFTARSTGLYEADGLANEQKALRSDIMDLITCYSTIPGFISIRNLNKGSLFIQVLCEVLDRRPDLEICEIFTVVNNALMNPKYYRAYNPLKLAHPCEFNSRLLKKLYLKDKS